MGKLAIHGGNPIRTKKFPRYKPISNEEVEAVSQVIKSGVLSQYLGAWHEDFYGGPKVRELEEKWSKFFGVKHAVAVNSATSGLYAAIGAAGVGPGDEVIVSSYTMSASATAALIYGGIPVFADIESDHYCLDVHSIEQKITPRTKAIIVVDIFGSPYDADVINSLAKKHGLIVIEDCAQAPGATYKNRFAGTLGDIGVYSLNYHKHIHTGEGGIIVTNDDELADRLRLIRNHAEAVIEAKGVTRLDNMVGFNYRMTEIEAAIAISQLKKLPKLLKLRQQNVAYLTEKLKDIPCLVTPTPREECTHAYYVHPLKYLRESMPVHRDTYIKAVKAELSPIEGRESHGVLIGTGYVKPLYLMPMYQNKIAFGKNHFPWSYGGYKGQVSYEKGLCPQAEMAHFETLITHELMHPEFTHEDLDDVAAAFLKVYQHRADL